MESDSADFNTSPHRSDEEILRDNWRVLQQTLRPQTDVEKEDVQRETVMIADSAGDAEALRATKRQKVGDELVWKKSVEVQN